jgi:hypothetical protein
MIGILMMAAGTIGLPVGILVVDATLLSNPYLLGVVAVGMLFFASVGFFGYIRPYMIYRKLPKVLVETDGKYLYIHTKKEAKIPLSALDGATVSCSLPYLYQKEFLDEFLVHLFSDKYGDIYLEVPRYGKYRLRFVSQVEETSKKLLRFIEDNL